MVEFQVLFRHFPALIVNTAEVTLQVLTAASMRVTSGILSCVVSWKFTDFSEAFSASIIRALMTEAVPSYTVQRFMWHLPSNTSELKIPGSDLDSRNTLHPRDMSSDEIKKDAWRDVSLNFLL
jgi:hypothetical protein